jgi:hypothetical protein
MKLKAGETNIWNSMVKEEETSRSMKTDLEVSNRNTKNSKTKLFFSRLKMKELPVNSMSKIRKSNNGEPDLKTLNTPENVNSKNGATVIEISNLSSITFESNTPTSKINLFLFQLKTND